MAVLLNSIFLIYKTCLFFSFPPFPIFAEGTRTTTMTMFVIAVGPMNEKGQHPGQNALLEGVWIRNRWLDKVLKVHLPKIVIA